MKVTWDDLSRAAWDERIAEHGGAVQQDWAYGEAMAALGGRVGRASVRSGARLVALAQFTLRRFAGTFGWSVCTRGPVWTEALSVEDQAAALRALRAAAPVPRPRLTVITPDDETAAAPRTARMIRIMTGYATGLIDLTVGDEALRAGLNGKWRNRLKSGEAAAFSVVRGGAKPAHYRWLLEAETQQRRARRYAGLPVDLAPAFAAAKSKGAGVAVWRADLGRDKAAAMLFLLHGRRATYHIGWTGEHGRSTGAHNVLMWRAMRDLRDEFGVDTLDVGGLDTASGAGVARFKLGAGAHPVVLAGSFV